MFVFKKLEYWKLHILKIREIILENFSEMSSRYVSIDNALPMSSTW